MDVPVKIDEDILKDVANSTDGQYYRATSKSSLADIYSEIDKLEKSKIDVNIFQNNTEEYLYFTIIAFVLLFIELILRLSIFRIKP
jgi:Ca-activated chloride channel family protein